MVFPRGATVCKSWQKHPWKTGHLFLFECCHTLSSSLKWKPLEFLKEKWIFEVNPCPSWGLFHTAHCPSLSCHWHYALCLQTWLFHNFLDAFPQSFCPYKHLSSLKVRPMSLPEEALLDSANPHLLFPFSDLLMSLPLLWSAEPIPPIFIECLLCVSNCALGMHRWTEWETWEQGGQTLRKRYKQ